MDKMHLEIVTPEGLIFSNDVKMVVLPGKEGEFGVLPGHAALVSLLDVGLVDIENIDGSHDIVAIDWGYAEVSENKVDVLVEGAVQVGGDSESEIGKSIAKAKDIVKKMASEGSNLSVAFSKIENFARMR